MRKIKLRSVYFLTAAVSLILSLGIAAGAANTQSSMPAENTQIAYDGYLNYASADGMTLLVNEKTAQFAVSDKNGKKWFSSPPDSEQDALAKGDALKLLMSLIQITYVDGLGNTNVLSSRKDSVDNNTYSVSKTENGARFEFLFERQGITVPVEIRLSENGFEAAVITEDITETEENFRLLRISLLPYFSAAASGTEGYIFVPDGSGALIDLKEGNSAADSYSQYVYGRDNATTKLENSAAEETVRLPVFGMKHGESGFTGIITSGDTRSIINASLHGKNTSYSNVYAEFIYRDADMVLVEKKNQTVRIVENAHTALNEQTVKYTLSEGDSSTYVGMAEIYREYLIGEFGLKKTESAGTPLVVELLGGVMTQQYVLGFPVKKVAPLTTFEDAVSIVDELVSAGVDDIILNYVWWNKDTTGAPLQTSLKPDSALGGKSGLEELTDYCKKNGISVFLDVNTNTMVKSTWGYNKKSDCSMTVQGNPAMQYKYSLSTNEAEMSSPSFLLTPEKLLGLTKKVADSAGKYQITGLSTSFLGESIYSDFGKREITRDESAEIWSDSLNVLSSATGSLYVKGGNAYSLPYADFISDTPVSSSNFIIETDEVPFYQIALRGLVPMSVTALNEQTDVREAFLKAVETGISFKYRWLARNETELVKTDYNDIMSARYKDWIDTAAEQYGETKDLFDKISGQSITGHQTVADGVTRTTWSNGTVVTVNFNKESVTVDGLVIEAQSFAVGEDE